MNYIFLATWTLLRSLPIFGSEDTNPALYLHSKPLTLSDFNRTNLRQDQPFRQATFDARSNLWLLGRSSIWRWDLGEDRLQKITLLQNPRTEYLSNLQQSRGYLYVASNRALYRVRFAPTEVKAFPHPNLRAGQSGRIIEGPKTIWWIHENGVAWLNQDGKLQVLPDLKRTIPRLRHAWFDPENRSLWYPYGQKLVRVDYRHSPPKQNTVHRANYAFSDVQGHRNHLMVHTNHTIIRFDGTQAIKQIIPVEGDRKLLTADLTTDIHTYFFSDKLLEIYDLRKSKRYQSRLEVPPKARIDKILTNGRYTLVLANGMPTIYTHERKNNVSKSSSRAPEKHKG